MTTYASPCDLTRIASLPTSRAALGGQACTLEVDVDEALRRSYRCAVAHCRTLLASGKSNALATLRAAQDKAITATLSMPVPILYAHEPTVPKAFLDWLNTEHEGILEAQHVASEFARGAYVPVDALGQVIHGVCVQAKAEHAVQCAFSAGILTEEQARQAVREAMYENRRIQSIEGEVSRRMANGELVRGVSVAIPPKHKAPKKSPRKEAVDSACMRMEVLLGMPVSKAEDVVRVMTCT